MRFLSLFSGIEAASAAWLPLGWECAGVAEIEPFPCAVLKHHYPDVPNLGDITKITGAQIAALGPVDLIVGGFPCQDLSIAGQRKGLKNTDGTATRSGLFFDAMRLVRLAREQCGLRWALIENVPGIFSSKSGRDFASLVSEMVGIGFSVPRGGWGNSGFALGPDGMLEWATLDAQFFGLAQRRQRLFALADFRDWASRGPVLLERESLRGNPPPRRETGQVAPTIPSRNSAGGGLGTDFDCDGGVIAVFGGNNTAGPIDVATALNAHGGPCGRMDFESETFIAHSLRGEGYDASEDGTGRGTPIVPVAFPGRMSATQCEAAAVRRLTPGECEKLQGFPLGYIDVPYRGKPAADGPRYKALGNSMAVPCVAWIGEKIAAAHAMGTSADIAA